MTTSDVLSTEEAKALHREVSGLLSYIHRVREEIASISRPADEEHHFVTMADQLDAVIQATDDASNMIMNCAEKNEESVAKLRGILTDKDQLAVLDTIADNDMEIIQACSFQDLTSQRVTKVARSITYVEERVTALADVWGRDELDKVNIKKSAKSDDEKLLNGPALDPQKAISQSEIDALFD